MFIYERHTLSRTNYVLRVSISNTKVSVLEWIRDTIGAGNIVETKRNSEKHALGYLLMINSQAALSLLEQIKPHVHLKDRQVTIAIVFQKNLKNPKLKAELEWQLESRLQIMELNKRGSKS